jgi:type I restriction enzyme R subunit
LRIVERIRPEIRKVGFWKNETLRDLLTKAIVRDLDSAAICSPQGVRDLALRLVVLARQRARQGIRN